ncbi:MAG: NYN domain-containing protein [Bacteroidota bacterium]
MVFIDGTNLFQRLRSAKLKLRLLKPAMTQLTGRRKLSRVYLYTSPHRLEEANAYHAPDWLEGIRVVLGDSIQRGDGSFKEKAVDALLVADLVYHAAQKNCDYAVLVAHDTDYRYAIRRVEDFGCRSAVAAFCIDAPDRLRYECDDYRLVTVEQLAGLTVSE